MISFESDYTTGAHPEILKRLAETNAEPLPGYGSDPYTERARRKIRAAIGRDEADVFFLVGGTQTNAIVISVLLKDYQGVIAAASGHISVHEAGAVEAGGHKVLELPDKEGKVRPARLRQYFESFYADGNHEHMVFPGMVYISHPTEYGGLYSKKELAEIADICRQYDALLYLDGARLAYGLMSPETDLTLGDIADLCDVFYIGGTKVGALCGEAVVFPRGTMPRHFLTSVKKRGGLLAKGRLLGIQFDALFTDDLYFRIGRHALGMAGKMKQIFRACGIPFYMDSPTNQQFVILENAAMEVLARRAAFSFWEILDETHTVVRFATGWSTTEAELEELRSALEDIRRDAGGDHGDGRIPETF